MKVWLNGDLVGEGEARIRVDDRGFLLGDGVFETIAVRDSNPLRLERHLARLAHGLRVCGIVPPYSRDDLEAAVRRTAEENGIEHGTIRLTVSRGPAPRGLRPPTKASPSVLIMAFVQSLAPPKPVKAVIAASTRRNEHSPLSRIKSLNYLEGILALKEAEDRGADEALLLNTAGFLAEASAANVFCVIGGKTATPPTRDGALPGVMRAAVIEAIGAAEQSITPDQLESASEVFLSNSGGIRAVVEIDGRR
ncbi:MAG: 2-keto-4-methylthiobutyrate aminotransferase, partial [Rhodospirillales bacterium]|nr:2-keto-4-methylthiobutyrate aminotransferase [Rhodospirillales bacterium]